MKHRISVTVDKENYQILSDAGVNISGQVSEAIGKEARRIKAEEWKKENSEGMEEVAKFIAQHGSFADENRNWLSCNALFMNIKELATTKCLWICRVILSKRRSVA